MSVALDFYSIYFYKDGGELREVVLSHHKMDEDMARHYLLNVLGVDYDESDGVEVYRAVFTTIDGKNTYTNGDTVKVEAYEAK